MPGFGFDVSGYLRVYLSTATFLRLFLFGDFCGGIDYALAG